MMLAGYLALNDTEIINDLRVLTYLRSLGGSNFEICLNGDFAEGAGYTDEYHDILDDDPYDTRNLCCYCAAMDTGPYATPETDGAAWYDADRPESADFLGLIGEFRLLPVTSRVVTQRSRGGADIGPMAPKARILQFEGIMYATSSPGMGYGERWLSWVLSAPGAGCAGDVANILPACPSDDVEDPQSAFRELVRVGLVDGPTFAPAARGGAIPECTLQQVTFQLAAGEPFLRRREEVIAEVAVTDEHTYEVTIDAPAVAGDVAIELIVAGAVTGMDVTVDVDATTVAEFTVNIDDGVVLTYDSSRRETRVDGGLGGLDLMDFTGLLGWAIAPAGRSMVVTISTVGATVGANATIALDKIVREL